jgi:hypothetical protein
MDWMRAEIAKMDAQWSHGARVGGATMSGILGSPVPLLRRLASSELARVHLHWIRSWAPTCRRRLH